MSQRQNKKFPDEVIIAIHRSNAKAETLAKKYGLHVTKVRLIKRGLYRADLHLGPTKVYREKYTRQLLGPRPEPTPDPRDDYYNYRLWRIDSDATTHDRPRRPNK